MIALLASLLPLAATTVAQPMIQLDDNKLTVTTLTVQAVFEGPVLKSLRPLNSDIEFIHPNANTVGLDLLYLNTELLGTDKLQTMQVFRVSDYAARIEVNGADTTRILLVAVDPDNGDIRLTPDGLSHRRGLCSVRWTLPVHGDVHTILPVLNGVQFRSTQHEPHTRKYRWPFEWNAQLAILERADYSVMIHCEDTDCRFKTLQLNRHADHAELGFESEPTGPLWDNRTAGGIEWRINAYRGDWKTPATRYKQWMEKAYHLADLRKHRPAWVKNISLAVSWGSSNPEMLDALATAHPPEQTLIHLCDWRTDPYDINYPNYVPNEKSLEYMKKARQMGFHIMPHFNYFSCSYKHPFYQIVRDFQIRTVDHNKPDGWFWPPDTHKVNRMAYIHPGLGTWRAKMTEGVIEACGKMGTDTAFLDQTFCTWNSDNGLVQSMNTNQGLRQLLADILVAQPNVVLAGEGLNEVSFQHQCFAQAHIYNGFGKLEQAHLELHHQLNQYLWGDHARLIGYHHLSPSDENYEKAVIVYEHMNALPTIITNNPDHIRNMSVITRRIFYRARGKTTTSQAE